LLGERALRPVINLADFSGFELLVKGSQSNHEIMTLLRQVDRPSASLRGSLASAWVG
jgi:hypothetical protein